VVTSLVLAPHAGAAPPKKRGGPAADARINFRAGDLPLITVLNQLARSARLSLVLDKDVQAGKTVDSPNLDDVPLSTALAVILTPLGYSFAIEDEERLLRVFVYDSRSFRVQVPVLTQEWDTHISNESQSGGGPQGAGLGAKVALRTRSDSEGLWKEIETSLKNLVGENGTFSVNRVAGFATVRTHPSVMASVSSYFDTFNAEMGRTVTIETKVLEVTFTDTRSVGVDWAAVGQRLNSLGAFVEGNIPQQPAMAEKSAAGVLHISGRFGDAFVRALEEQGDVKVVAQPTLVLGNNLPAIIEAGTLHTYVARQSVVVSQNGPAVVTAEPASLTDGLILSILPRVLDTGEVTLALATVSNEEPSFTRHDTGSFGNIQSFISLPKLGRRTYSGVVRAKMGESLVIGGLIANRLQNKRDGIPFLARIPIVGFLFGVNQKREAKTELVVSITPRLVKPGVAAVGLD
jgi:type IVB pilus formation R64 PilN family outer membrane protein